VTKGKVTAEGTSALPHAHRELAQATACGSAAPTGNASGEAAEAAAAAETTAEAVRVRGLRSLSARGDRLLNLVIRAGLDPSGCTEKNDLVDLAARAGLAAPAAFLERAANETGAHAGAATTAHVAASAEIQAQAQAMGSGAAAGRSEPGEAVFKVVAATALAPGKGPGVYFSPPERWTGRFTGPLFRQVS